MSEGAFEDMILEDLREELQGSLPGSLLESSRLLSNSNSSNNSSNNSSSDAQQQHTDGVLDEALGFLDAHALPDQESWKRKLLRFVAFKEFLEGKKKNTDPGVVFPQAPMNKLLDLEDEDGSMAGLLEEMLLADGASGGNYGRAMEIYRDIHSESDAVEDTEDHPVLHRLAVAIALVHATPVVQTNPSAAEPDAVEDTVDPVRRYLNYEIAYLEGELDPSFPTLTTWELRFVVDGDEPDEIAQWGRRALLRFYPDHALNNDPNWLYAAIVRTNVPYGSERVNQDDPKNHKYQNILLNGGICGRRAFFGRFILRAFGIPTTARPSKGHAALAHWVPPDGDWVVNLGGNFGAGWTKTRYVKDLDFLATARARTHTKDYPRVKLAQWIGELFDEQRVYGVYDPKQLGRGKGVLLDLQQASAVGLWYRLSLRVQESILGGNNAVAPRNAAAKRAPGPADDPLVTVTETAMKASSLAGKPVFVSEGDGGRPTFRIPASSYSNPRRTKDVTIMKGIVVPGDEDNGEIPTRASSSAAGGDPGNQQIYLPPFQQEGTTILRVDNNGGRLLSAGKGKYSDWGFRAAMTVNDEDLGGSCPEPTITLALTEDDDDPVTIEFVYIPPGTFVMGGSRKDEDRFHCVEVPHHTVEISNGFYMGKYPVTQEQFKAVTGKNPSPTNEPKCPVGNVGEGPARTFCNSVHDSTGFHVRLPTEAEWEYTARGNTCPTSADRMWFFSKKDGDHDRSLLGEYAWHPGNSEPKKAYPVGLKKPNPFGIYDMYGNILERVSDTYKKEYYAECANAEGGVVKDPTGPSQGVKSKLRYEVNDVPEAGTYLLKAVVCTINVRQRIKVSPVGFNDDAGSSVLELPYTLGEWRETDPVSLVLQKGKNTLHFWRDEPPQYGVSVREFVLTKAD
eukprot:CAMPEP_0201120260 /NCGR_PEP_ID=MMETSP0850-20130426/4341_1 /ASSEMBLY_ACC=CAM_ASM_000622 /TAXON_ID=183588 /ORGANISM="Pseudo-nitzschia fraudulenta, Strain WWA7" /LENGTH=903 /DNA_ID=CAMNT_0047386335 /DNA_START=271 /DNA_END=2982 /DNA_ORIENTATION=-